MIFNVRNPTFLVCSHISRSYTDGHMVAAGSVRHRLNETDTKLLIIDKLKSGTVRLKLDSNV